MPWKKLLAWATGQIDEALRQKLEFVLEENRVYRTLVVGKNPIQVENAGFLRPESGVKRVRFC